MNSKETLYQKISKAISMANGAQIERIKRNKMTVKGLVEIIQDQRYEDIVRNIAADKLIEVIEKDKDFTTAEIGHVMSLTPRRAHK